MTHALLSGAAAFAVALLAGRPFVHWIRAQRLGKAISEEGPSSHNIKAGTPTMGGLLIFAAVAIVTIPTNLFERLSILLPLGVVLSGMIVGAIDDLGTLTDRFRQRAALSWRLKFLYQLALSAIVAGVLYFALEVQSINIPWLGQFELGLFYIPIAIATVIATTTAVSITDGLDGLLGGTAAIAFGAYGVIAFIQGQLFLANFSFTVAGALLGFLWFNTYPAQVFMGDIGALALGAALGVVAVVVRHEIVLLIMGGLFVVEAVSVIIQVVSFRLTGRRVFRMAPIHHHFELMGWPEPRVIVRLWIITLVLVLIGLSTLKLR